MIFSLLVLKFELINSLLNPKFLIVFSTKKEFLSRLYLPSHRPLDYLFNKKFSKVVALSFNPNNINSSF